MSDLIPHTAIFLYHNVNVEIIPKPYNTFQTKLFFHRIYFDIKNNIVNFALLISPRPEMKYKELHKILWKGGMIELDEQRAGHPLWVNPKTGEKFTTSNNGTHEVATGTLKSILRTAGIENKQ